MGSEPVSPASSTSQWVRKLSLRPRCVCFWGVLIEWCPSVDTRKLWKDMGVSKNRGKTPKWMVKIMENPIKMDDLGVPYFWKHPYGNWETWYSPIHPIHLRILPWIWRKLMADSRAGEFKSMLYTTLSILTGSNRSESYIYKSLAQRIWWAEVKTSTCFTPVDGPRPTSFCALLFCRH